MTIIEDSWKRIRHKHRIQSFAKTFETAFARGRQGVPCDIRGAGDRAEGNHEPKRPQTPLHKGIRKLAGKTSQRGYSLVPLRIYFKGPWAKVEIGLAKGKKLYDKREDIAERDRQRETERRLKERQRG